MKHLLLLLIGLFACMAKTSAQSFTVTYEARFNTESPELFAESGLSEDLRRSMAAAYRDVVLTFRLDWNLGESEYRMVPSSEKQVITFMGQTIDLNAAMGAQANNVTYKNHKSRAIIEKVSVFGKDFLVTDSIGQESFDIVENEKKEILGYECTKAVSKNGKITAYFSPHIPIKDEPISSGLPGLIFEYDNGSQTFKAVSIEDSDDKTIAVPTGGKEMSRKDFEKMVKSRVEMLKR